ncbi:MAG TPA: hypothetical protein VEA59_03210 [Patescibacteria group bacterium]|nr:hypothetical protein [Patescibacteria group bacterium]
MTFLRELTVWQRFLLAVFCACILYGLPLANALYAVHFDFISEIVTREGRTGLLLFRSWYLPPDEVEVYRRSIFVATPLAAISLAFLAYSWGPKVSRHRGVGW